MIRSVFMVCSVVAGCATGSGGSSADTTPASAQIGTPEQAVERALEYTGFDESASFEPRPAEEITEVSRMMWPEGILAGDSCRERDVWQITFESIVLNINTIPEDTEKDYPKDFVVYLDAKTGELLKVLSPYEATGESEQDHPWADIPHQHHLGQNVSMHTTSQRPVVTLFAALAGGCMTDVLSSQEIEAYLGKCQFRRLPHEKWIDEENPIAWLLITKGLSVLSTEGDSTESENAKPFEESCLINAVTGVPSATLFVGKGKHGW
jgi:hypothetical protein